MGFIYLLYNEKGEGYIGQTRNIKNRIARHRSPCGDSSSSKLLGDFEWLILEEVENDCLNDYEQYYYDLYKNDGLVNRCRPGNTQAEYHKIYQKNNREKVNEANRKSAEKHKETKRLWLLNRDKEQRNARERELYKIRKLKSLNI